MEQPGKEQDFSIAELSEALHQSQSDIESEKTQLVRLLHDDLGGFLVGAIMDIGWISQQDQHSEAVKEKLSRAAASLRAAVDLKRQLFESLRPSLLDNVGLFATLRWHVKSLCDDAGVPYIESYPEVEIYLRSDVRIVVFRIIQEVLKDLLSSTPRELSLEIHVSGDTLQCHLTSETFETGNKVRDRVSLQTSVRHRVHAVGGTLRWVRSGGANRVDLQIPFS